MRGPKWALTSSSEDDDFITSETRDLTGFLAVAVEP
jgi:hypothetical protein